MNSNSSMSKIVDGKRYKVATATLLADDCYWDGSNFERHGRNTFLYKTKNGAYFEHTVTQWQGERDDIRPVNVDEAKELYESLSEHSKTYEEAFGVVPEEA